VYLEKGERDQEHLRSVEGAGPGMCRLTAPSKKKSESTLLRMGKRKK